MYRSTRLLAAIAMAAIVMTGCKSDDNGEMATGASPAMGAVNDVCPVMPDRPVAADGGTVQYNGATIGFCCPGCVGQWDSKSDAEKQAFLNKYKN